MSYADRKEFGPRQATALGLSLLLIGFLSWAFINGLVVKVMKIAVGPVKLIKDKAPPPPDTPPPPPPKLDEVPPYVPPPEVDVSVPQMNSAPAIQTQNVVEKPKERVVEPPPPPPPPPKEKVRIPAETSSLNRAIKNSADYYPSRAIDLKQQGTSVCTYVVPLTGRVQDTKCDGAGDLLDRAAEKLLNSQKAKPATEDGAPIASSGRVRITWVLPKDE